MDQPLVWYEGAGTSDKRRLYADERGSVIAVEAAGGVTKNTYDAYGVPGAGNLGRFQYTGQAWLAEVSLYHYKARAYDPLLGRFMQTDPIGYADQMNLYAYVGNDPVNATDPSGMACEPTGNDVVGDSATVVCANDGEAYGTREDAVASVAENLIDFTNETGFEAFAVISESADGFVVSDAVSTGAGPSGEQQVDIGLALDALGVGSLVYDYRVGDLHTHPGDDFYARFFSEEDYLVTQSALGDNRDFMINNFGISALDRKSFPGSPVSDGLGGVAYRGRSVATRDPATGDFTLNNPPRGRRR